MKYAKNIVIDLALVIECKEEELLPERLLCAWRLMRPDLANTYNMDNECEKYPVYEHNHPTNSTSISLPRIV